MLFMALVFLPCMLQEMLLPHGRLQPVCAPSHSLLQQRQLLVLTGCWSAGKSLSLMPCDLHALLRPSPKTVHHVMHMLRAHAADDASALVVLCHCRNSMTGLQYIAHS